MKRLICLILALLLLCPTAFAAEDLRFTFTQEEGKVGDTVKITAAAKGSPIACSFKHVLVYDPAVLKPVAVKQLDCKGFFMNNLNADHEGKAAVNVLTADAKKAFEGDCNLYTVSFEILSAPKSGKTTIAIPYYECYDADLKKLDAAFDALEIKVITDAPAQEPDEKDEPAEEPDEKDEPAEEPSDEKDEPAKEPSDEKDDQQASGETPDTEANKDSLPPAQGDSTASGGSESEPSKPVENKKPVTGEWQIFEQTEEVTHSENGDITVYKGEFIYDEENNLTDIQLYDEEGKPAGSVKVEPDEDGAPQVVEQNLASDEEAGGFNHLYWIIPAAALLLAGGIAAFMIIKNKKKEEE